MESRHQQPNDSGVTMAPLTIKAVQNGLGGRLALVKRPLIQPCKPNWWQLWLPRTLHNNVPVCSLLQPGPSEGDRRRYAGTGTGTTNRRRRTTILSEPGLVAVCMLRVGRTQYHN